ncbi:MAG: hypothetical protein HKN80_04005 [Acidimicrobiia bacterium]|nr:hypothetical protein [Acidimicrobiia bacterium]
MRRVIVVAVSVALFTTLFASLAAAAPTSGSGSGHADAVSRVDDGDRVDGMSILKRCRRLLGEDELAVGAKEKCIQLWKRWCNAHPRARRCPRPKPPPPCRITDRVIDRRCLPVPCLPADQIVDRRCVPDPCLARDGAGDRWCDPCRVTVVDRLCIPDPCLAADRVCVPPPCVTEDGGIVKCIPIPTSTPTDQPLVRPDRLERRPPDKPAETRQKVEVLERPVDEPADSGRYDRILDRAVERLTDRVGNDVHARTVDADS